MNKKFQSILEQLVPFLILGIALAFSVAVLIMFSYLLLWGLVIGGVLWLVYFIKSYFFPKNKKKPEGRIIEHHEND